MRETIHNKVDERLSTRELSYINNHQIIKEPTRGLYHSYRDPEPFRNIDKILGTGTRMLGNANASLWVEEEENSLKKRRPVMKRREGERAREENDKESYEEKRRKKRRERRRREKR